MSKKCLTQAPALTANELYRGRPVYHPIITKSQYQRDTESWVSRRRREEITWRVACLVALAVFAFLVLD